jgi:hypothetical protein
MPRNSTGVYTLPLPPVVAGEVIESLWANTSLDDIGQALTDSLDRYGRGGMLAPFLFFDGTVSAPGAAWANAPGTGFFRVAGYLGASWNGAEIFNFNGNGIALAAGKEVFLPQAPATGTSAVNKTYVDTADAVLQAAIDAVSGSLAGYLPLTGGSMTGTITYDATNAPSGSPAFQISNAADKSMWLGLDNRPSGATGIVTVDGALAIWTKNAQRAIFFENTAVFDIVPLFNMGAVVAAQSVYELRNVANDAPAWRIGAGSYTGNAAFGVYNVPLGVWGMLIDPTTNAVTFRGGLTMFNLINAAQDGIVMGGVAGQPTTRILLGSQPDSANLGIEYDRATGTSSFGLLTTLQAAMQPRLQFLNDASVIIPVEVPLFRVYMNVASSWLDFAPYNNNAYPAIGFYQGGVREWKQWMDAPAGNLIFTPVGSGGEFIMAADGTFRIIAQQKALSWVSGSEERMSVYLANGLYPGINWYWPGVLYFGIFQASSGNLWFSTQNDINNVQTCITGGGDVRAKRFIATPNPGI